MAAIKSVVEAAKLVPTTCKAQVEASFRPEIDALEKRFQVQLDTLSAKVAAIDGRTDQLSTGMGEMRASMY